MLSLDLVNYFIGHRSAQRSGFSNEDIASFFTGVFHVSISMCCLH